MKMQIDCYFGMAVQPDTCEVTATPDSDILLIDFDDWDDVLCHKIGLSEAQVMGLISALTLALSHMRKSSSGGEMTFQAYDYDGDEKHSVVAQILGEGNFDASSEWTGGHR
jgi:hypothetical protein